MEKIEMHKQSVGAITNNSWSILKSRKAFTLVELLIVIAIIGILGSVVMVSLSSAREKANRASVLATLSGVMSEISICMIDEGGTDGYAAGTPICTDGAATPIAGHETLLWPEVTTKTGWTIAAPQTDLFDNDYEFGATKSGQDAISCRLASNSCQ